MSTLHEQIEEKINSLMSPTKPLYNSEVSQVQALKWVLSLLPSPAEGASLEQIMDEVATEQGYVNWMTRDENRKLVKMVAERYAAQQSQAKTAEGWTDEDMKKSYSAGHHAGVHGYISFGEWIKGYRKPKRESQAKASAITGKFSVAQNEEGDYTTFFDENGPLETIVGVDKQEDRANHFADTLNPLFSSSQTSPVGEGNAELVSVIKQLLPMAKDAAKQARNAGIAHQEFLKDDDEAIERAVTAIASYESGNPLCPVGEGFLKVAVEDELPKDSGLFTVIIDGRQIPDVTYSHVLNKWAISKGEVTHWFKPVTFPLSSSHPEVSNNGWIVVNERSPESDNYLCLVWCSGSDIPKKARYMKGAFWTTQTTRIINKVTHWMPLPKGPSIEANA